MIRNFSKKVQISKLNESFFLIGRFDGNANIVEIPDTDVNKDICTPVIIKRFSSEALTPWLSYHNIFGVNYASIGPTVMDLLTHIRNSLDTSLTFRKSCGQGVCGICAMNINGVNTFACIAPTTPGATMQISPLTGYAPIRDLVVDYYPLYNNGKKVKPWLKAKKPQSKELLQTPENQKKLEKIYECVLCGCCNSSCPSFGWNRRVYSGPAVLLQAYRGIIDSRDEIFEERMKNLLDLQQAKYCDKTGTCKTSCPLGIDPYEAIVDIKEKIEEYQAKSKEWKP